LQKTVGATLFESLERSKSSESVKVIRGTHVHACEIFAAARRITGKDGRHAHRRARLYRNAAIVRDDARRSHTECGF
jgi:hypothetical protein